RRGFGHPQRRTRAHPPSRLCRHHGHSSGGGALSRRSARRRSRADGHRLADRGGKIGAGAAAKSIRALRTDGRRTADDCERQHVEAAWRRLIQQTGESDMSKELYWLVLTAAMTGLLWVPYILDRIMVRGAMGATANPSPTDKPQSA